MHPWGWREHATSVTWSGGPVCHIGPVWVFHCSAGDVALGVGIHGGLGKAVLVASASTPVGRPSTNSDWFMGREQAIA